MGISTQCVNLSEKVASHMALRRLWRNLHLILIQGINA